MNQTTSWSSLLLSQQFKSLVLFWPFRSTARLSKNRTMPLWQACPQSVSYKKIKTNFKKEEAAMLAKASFDHKNTSLINKIGYGFSLEHRSSLLYYELHHGS